MATRSKTGLSLGSTALLLVTVSVPSLSGCASDPQSLTEKAFISLANAKCRSEWAQIELAEKAYELAKGTEQGQKAADRLAEVQRDLSDRIGSLAAPPSMRPVITSFREGAEEIEEQLANREITPKTAEARLRKLQKDLADAGLKDCVYRP